MAISYDGTWVRKAKYGWLTPTGQLRLGEEKEQDYYVNVEKFGALSRYTAPVFEEDGRYHQIDIWREKDGTVTPSPNNDRKPTKVMLEVIEYVYQNGGQAPEDKK